MIIEEVRKKIRQIIRDEQKPLCETGYWDDGPAPLSDETINKIIMAAEPLYVDRA